MRALFLDVFPSRPGRLDDRGDEVRRLRQLDMLLPFRETDSLVSLGLDTVRAFESVQIVRIGPSIMSPIWCPSCIAKYQCTDKGLLEGK